MIIEWMHKRQAIITQARALLDQAAKEERDLNAEEDARYNQLLAEADALQKKIDREKELQQRESTLDQPASRALKPVADDAATIGMSPKDVRRYSLIRAINAMATGNWRDAQLELEASQTVAKRLGHDPQGIFVPYDWIHAKRDMTVGVPTQGGNLVATDLLAADFISLLRNRMVIRQAGARMLTGLVGDVAIPRQTGGATAYWVSEGNAPNESTQGVDQVALTPHTLGAYTDISRKLLKQSSIDVETFVREDLAAVVGLEIDRAGLHGTGLNNQPTGLSGAGINTATTGAATWAKVVELETLVAADNADVATMAYMMNATERGLLKTTEKVSGYPVFLWENGANPVNGYPALVSNQVAAKKILFGNWADLLIGMWGALDLMVDPYTNGIAGTVRIIALQDVDVAVRHPESFSILDTTP